eukprot:5643226-Karenia_brevis.AAC.1
MAVESNLAMEHSCRSRFNSTRPKFILITYGIITGSIMAYILRATISPGAVSAESLADKADA